MSQPQAVAAQAQRATELIQQLAQSDGNPAATPAAPGQPQPASSAQPQPQPGAAAQAAPGAPDTPPATDPRETDPAYWRARFEVMQGKYNAEVPALTQQVQDLRAQLDELQRQPAASPAPAAPLTEDELKEYTPEYFDMMGRFVESKVKPVVAQKDEQLGQLSTQVATLQDSLLQQYEANLDLLVPKWREINVMPQFIAWLNGTVVSTNPPLMAMDALQDAHARRNAVKVAQIFLDWARSAGADPGKPQPGFIAEPPAGGPPPSAPNQNPPQGRIWKRSEISAFYADVARGYYRGRESEKAQLEADIMAASQQGRVVEG